MIFTEKNKRLKELLIFSVFLVLCLALLMACSTTKLPTNCCVNEEKIPDSLTRVLFVFAHQDDEVFIATRLFNHIEQQDSIFCIWTSKSDFRSKKYGRKRIKESKSAMESIGVDTSNLYFLELPDGATQNHIPEIMAKLKPLIKAIDPEIIYLPAYEMGHIDHDIANFTTVQATKELDLNPVIFEFPIYNVANTSKLMLFKVRQLPDSINTYCRLLSKEEFTSVVNFWYLYPSQYFPLDPYIRYTVGYKKAFGFEYYRKIPEYNYLKKPFKADVAYERFLSGPTFSDFQKAVSEYLNQNK